jgi:hypothetical protein
MSWRSKLLSVFKLANHSQKVREINQVDLLSCRNMKGNNISANENPGFRIEKSFINDSLESEILNEVETFSTYKFKSQETLYMKSTDVSNTSNEDNKYSIDSYRVTGRPEVFHQIHAPWGYGDSFKEQFVPKAINQLAKNIYNSSYFNLRSNSSSLRDITINYRSNSMFRLDPHIDPPLDGSNVFVIGFKSDVVFTFTPDLNSEAYLKSTSQMNTKLKVRTDEMAIAVRSWTDDDLDIMLQSRDLLHFTGNARYIWKHAIRAGLEVGPPYDGICDWWGSLDHLSKRNSDRISIIFAFS